MFKPSRPGVNIGTPHDLRLWRDLDDMEARADVQVEPAAVHAEAAMGQADADPAAWDASFTCPSILSRVVHHWSLQVELTDFLQKT